MKKFTLTLLGLGISVFVCQADVLIYKTKVAATVTGNGEVRKTKVRGFVVIDPNTFQVANVAVESASFHIFEFTNAAFAQIDAGKGKRLTALSFPGNGIGSVMGTGINASLITGTITSYLAPKTFKITANEISNDRSSTEIDSGTLIFDQVDTVTENGTARGFDGTVSDIEQTLLNEGFIEN